MGERGQRTTTFLSLLLFDSERVKFLDLRVLPYLEVFKDRLSSFGTEQLFSMSGDSKQNKNPPTKNGSCTTTA